jgi:hypothetical protein
MMLRPRHAQRGVDQHRLPLLYNLASRWAAASYFRACDSSLATRRCTSSVFAMLFLFYPPCWFILTIHVLRAA